MLRVFWFHVLCVFLWGGRNSPPFSGQSPQKVGAQRKYFPWMVSGAACNQTTQPSALIRWTKGGSAIRTHRPYVHLQLRLLSGLQVAHWKDAILCCRQHAAQNAFRACLPGRTGICVRCHTCVTRASPAMGSITMLYSAPGHILLLKTCTAALNMTLRPLVLPKHR